MFRFFLLARQPSLVYELVKFLGLQLVHCLSLPLHKVSVCVGKVCVLLEALFKLFVLAHRAPLRN